MSTMRKAALAVVAAAAVGIGFAAWGAGAANGQAGGTTPKLTAGDRAGLVFSREEERMARELYTLFADKYAVGPFTMISRSEQRHFDEVGALLTRYAVADPSAGATTGVYADATVQKLYDGWKASGLASVDAAYRVGVALEKRDIADLDRLGAGTSNVDLDRLHGRLRNGSQHHLAAFTAAADGTPMPGMGTGGPGRGRNGGGMGGMGGQGSGAGRGAGARGDGCPMA